MRFKEAVRNIMALHDVDKQNNNRANPKLNVEDGVATRMAHETVGTTYRTVGSGVTPSIVMQQGALQSYDSSGNKNMFFGYLPSVSATRPVLRIAKTGYDATTASTDNLIFNSEQNVFKIVSSGTVTVSKAASNTRGSVTLKHGLSYTPLVISFLYDGSIYIPVPYLSIILSGTGVGTVYSNNYLFTTITDLSFNVETPTSSPGYALAYDTIFKYYILQETAN